VDLHRLVRRPVAHSQDVDVEVELRHLLRLHVGNVLDVMKTGKGKKKALDSRSSTPIHVKYCHRTDRSTSRFRSTLVQQSLTQFHWSNII
jgi:hypothetical protein